MKAKRLMALLLCLLTLIGVIPFGGAFAAGSTVTIESQTNSAFDYIGSSRQARLSTAWSILRGTRMVRHIPQLPHLLSFREVRLPV